MMIDTKLAIRPLSPFGAEVTGVDLTAPIDAATAEAMRQAFRDHALVLFRNAELNKEQLLATAAVFGPVSDQGEAPGGFNYLSTVVQPGAQPNGEWALNGGFGEQTFHIDHCFQEQPLKAIMLYGVEVPPPGSGGDTLFSDSRIATRMLPENLRKRIQGLSILHKATPRRNPRPEAVKPILREHTGPEPILFFSPTHATKFMELPDDESDALIAELREHVIIPESIYRHVWQPKDLVVWDNIALQHARTDFDKSLRRHMMRIQIGFPQN